MRVLAQRSEPGERLREDLLIAVRRARPGPGHANHEQGGNEGDGGHDAEDLLDAGDGQQDAREDARQQHGATLDPARHDVRRGQLLSGARQRGHHHGLSGPRDRDGRRRDDRTGVDHGHGRAGGDRRSRDAHARGLREVAADEHAHRPVAIDQHGEERRADRGGRQLEDGDEARLVRASAVVGEHQHRDPDGVLREVEPGVGQLDAAQVAVAENRAEDAHRLQRSAFPRPRSAANGCLRRSQRHGRKSRRPYGIDAIVARPGASARGADTRRVRCVRVEQAMRLPVLLAVDDDRDALDDVETQLAERYAHEYRVESLGDPEDALRMLQELADAGEDVALVLAASSLSATSGGHLLEHVRRLHPHAGRVLLVPRVLLDGSADRRRDPRRDGARAHRLLRAPAGGPARRGVPRGHLGLPARVGEGSARRSADGAHRRRDVVRAAPTS